MNLSFLKRFRVIFSGLVLVLFLIVFIDFTNLIPEKVYDTTLFLQFIPSLLIFKKLFTIAGVGFILIIAINLIWGRVYCSFICPLGILQDVISFIAKKVKRLKRYKYVYQKPLSWLRYGFLGLFIVGLLSGLTVIVSLLDPYSIFGRISSGVFRPLVVKGNNMAVSILQKFDIYTLFHVDLKPQHWSVFAVSLFFLILITVLSVNNGRLFCNTVCPVGTFLGLISKWSIFKISIDKETCTSCKLCERVCKAGCINIPDQTVDVSRCVNCYNCLTVCPVDSVRYSTKSIKNNVEKEKIANKKINPNRRHFLALVALIFTARKANSQKIVSNNATVPIERTVPVSPPGSISVEKFNLACTACHLCISACPTHVLQPSYTQYGLIGFMQPVLDNHAGFCNFDCVKCGEVCPTGAIELLNLEEKKVTQIGISKFVKENCIVVTEGTDCGACAEHCPTKAVHMVPYKDNLVIPEVNEDICIGCGACEYPCPTTPYKAIYVEGNAVHKLAEKPEETEQKKEIEEDFPF
jgi:ferredoxin